MKVVMRCLLIESCLNVAGAGMLQETGAAGMGGYPRLSPREAGWSLNQSLRLYIHKITKEEPNVTKLLLTRDFISGICKCKTLLPSWCFGPIPAATIISSNNMWQLREALRLNKLPAAVVSCFEAFSGIFRSSLAVLLKQSINVLKY